MIYGSALNAAEEVLSLFGKKPFVGIAPFSVFVPIDLMDGGWHRRSKLHRIKTFADFDRQINLLSEGFQ